MTLRFNRDYELVIGTGVSAAIIRPPMRVVFSAQKAINGYGVNKCTCRIYNLKEQTRLAMVKDAEDLQTYIPFRLSAGYEGSKEIIFKGSVHVGHNKFEAPEFITTIESLDGGFALLNSFTSAVVDNEDAAYNKVVSDLLNVSKGKFTTTKKLSRPRVLFGSSIETLESMLDPDETWYVDNEQLYIIKENEVTSRYIPVVSAETGLLDTPERQNRIVTCSTKINPAIKIGGLCEIKSAVAPHLNAIYKVNAIEYNGDFDGDDWNQTISLKAIEGYTVL